MPSVFVVPVYVEVPEGFERAVFVLESHLRRAGYAFRMGEPQACSLDQMADIAPLQEGLANDQQILCPKCGGEIEPDQRPAEALPFLQPHLSR